MDDPQELVEMSEKDLFDAPDLDPNMLETKMDSAMDLTSLFE